jgi:hypothetical protein
MALKSHLVQPSSPPRAYGHSETRCACSLQSGRVGPLQKRLTSLITITLPVQYKEHKKEIEP